MSDLRGTIKDLRNVARRLDAATFNPDMNALKEFVDKLDKTDGEYKPSDDVREKALAKYLRGDYDFTNRELRDLPFIIHERELTIDDAKKILSLLDLGNKRHLSRLVNVYLNQYDDSAKTELLRRRLSFIPKDFTDSTRLRKIFASKDKLFADNRMANMVKFLTQKLSVEGALEDMGLTNFYKASRYIQDALKLFFRHSPASLDDQFKLLDELDSEFDTYKNIFPSVADTIIQAVARAGIDKQKCMEIFYRRLGDPRFGNSCFNWNNVSQKSKEIFCHWLSEKDLETFFELIRQTAVDSMWRYREKFWRAYLPDIIKTRIFLGSDARRLAASISNLNHGALSGAGSDQSVFIFQIGRYIFSEWSHSGKLRVHISKKTQTLFDEEESFFVDKKISRDALIVKPKAEWIHSSPSTYFWQREVSDWIKKSCGIKKTIDDWGL